MVSVSLEEFGGRNVSTPLLVSAFSTFRNPTADFWQQAGSREIYKKEEFR